MPFYCMFSLDLLNKFHPHKRRSLKGMLYASYDSAEEVCRHLEKLGLVRCVWWEAPDDMFSSMYVWEQV